MSLALNGGGDGSPYDVDFLDASPPLSFTFYRASLGALLPGGAPTSGGTFVTVSGGGLTAENASSVRCRRARL